MNIKTETKEIVVHKAGLYMTIDELHRCIMALCRDGGIEDEDRKLAEDLSLIQTNALAENWQNKRKSTLSYWKRSN